MMDRGSVPAPAVVRQSSQVKSCVHVSTGDLRSTHLLLFQQASKQSEPLMGRAESEDIFRVTLHDYRTDPACPA